MSNEGWLLLQLTTKTLTIGSEGQLDGSGLSAALILGPFLCLVQVSYKVGVGPDRRDFC